jgi:hypothetical protein
MEHDMTVPWNIALLAAASALAGCSVPAGPNGPQTRDVRPKGVTNEADQSAAKPVVRPAPVQPPAEIDPRREDPNNATAPD